MRLSTNLRVKIDSIEFSKINLIYFKFVPKFPNFNSFHFLFLNVISRKCPKIVCIYKVSNLSHRTHHTNNITLFCEYYVCRSQIDTLKGLFINNRARQGNYQKLAFTFSELIMCGLPVCVRCKYMN